VLRVSGKAVAMNCCDGGEVIVSTDRFAANFYVFWRAAPGGGHLDLATGSSGSSPVELDVGCDPTTSDCRDGHAEASFASGFQGTIDYALAPQQEATYCLSVAESSGNPQPVIHSVELYAPKIASPL